MVRELTELSPKTAAFRSSQDVLPAIREACDENHDIATYHEIGKSETGVPICAAVIGAGPATVSLVAGAHSDEPVGPETLRTLILALLANRARFSDLLQEFRFVIIPHVNPDGESRNQTWIRDWPDIESYIRSVFRELPGRDVEFGYPAMRPENKAVSGFLSGFAPISLHASLHGMGFSDGVMLLLGKTWIEKTAGLRKAFSAYAKTLNLRLHDHDRAGEKGFHHIGPGYTTTPAGKAMREHFHAQGDPEMAGLFHDSSMEFVAGLGGAPLCMVTELPLFLIRKEAESRPGIPAAYLEFKSALPEIRSRLATGVSVTELLAPFDLQPLPLEMQIEMQLYAIQLCLNLVTEAA